MPAVRTDFEKTASDLSQMARDTAYVAVGLGILGFQQAQVRRRELLEQIERQASAMEAASAEGGPDWATALKEIDRAVSRVVELFDASIEPVTERLPAGAQAVVHQARAIRDQVRGYITSLAS